MTHATANDRAVAGLPRLDDLGRAVLFTQARTANSFSDRPGYRRPAQGNLRAHEVGTALGQHRPAPHRLRHHPGGQGPPDASPPARQCREGNRSPGQCHPGRGQQLPPSHPQAAALPPGDARRPRKRPRAARPDRHRQRLAPSVTLDMSPGAPVREDMASEAI